MTKPTGIGRGGTRAGGRPKGSLNKKTLAKLAASQLAGAVSEPLFPVKANGGLAIPALHRLMSDARADLGHRLRRVEQTGADNGKRLEAMQEMLERVLKHQAAISRHLGAIETPTTPRIYRRRPLDG